MNVDELWRLFCAAESDLEKLRIAHLLNAVIARDTRPLSEKAARACLRTGVPARKREGRPARRTPLVASA